MSKLRKTLLLLLAVLALLVIGSYVFLQLQLDKVGRLTAGETQFGAEDFEADGDHEDTLDAVEWSKLNGITAKEGVTNILLVGQDTREEGERARSDSMILLSIDSNRQQLSMVSLMRDLYVQIPGYQPNKINAAYRFGGFELLDSTIETNFGISVDYNVAVDFNGFKDIIDAMGGIDLRLSQAEVDYLSGATEDGRKHSGTDPISGLRAGMNHLDGDAALAYARTRYVATENARDDFGRTERQRIVIQTVFQALKQQPWTELLSLYDAVADDISTDMTNDEMLSMALTVYSMGADSIQEYRIPEDGGYTNEWVRKMAVLVPTSWDLLRANLQDFLYGEA